MSLSIELKAIIVSIVFGGLTVIVYASQSVFASQSLNASQSLYASQSPPQFASILGVAFIIAFTAFVSGGLLGFLFGIPRKNEPGEDTPKDKGPSYLINTNLEEISDWLTKILVGVGLTQISKLPQILQNYADFTAVGLGNYPSSGIFSIALLVYFLICGFLIGYIVTRLHLPKAFTKADLAAYEKRQADLDALRNKISDMQEETKIEEKTLSADLAAREKVETDLAALRNKISDMQTETKIEEKTLSAVKSTVSDIQKKAEIGARALSAVQRQLNPGMDTPPISQYELSVAIQLASSNTRAQAFYLAREFRDKYWNTDKPRMERTISIFKALIASDTDDVYQWKEAESELTKAIELRGTWQDKVWLTYEFARAICRIHLDEAFGQKKETEENTKQTILDDLKAAAHSLRLEKCIEKNPDISEWMEINNINNLRE
jgi:uncharacterized membrane-anchored protein YhcB (DUF1043 family)